MPSTIRPDSSTPSPPAATGRAAKVVVVDDDEHIRELASLYLGKEGSTSRARWTGTTPCRTIRDKSSRRWSCST